MRNLNSPSHVLNMTDREKLEWIINHNGDCYERPFECDKCPLCVKCMFIINDYEIVEQAKKLIAKEQP